MFHCKHSCTSMCTLSVCIRCMWITIIYFYTTILFIRILYIILLVHPYTTFSCTGSLLSLACVRRMVRPRLMEQDSCPRLENFRLDYVLCVLCLLCVLCVPCLLYILCVLQGSAHTGRVWSGPTTTNYRMTTTSCIPTSLPIFYLNT